MDKCEICNFYKLVMDKQINDEIAKIELCSHCLFKTLTDTQIDELIKISTVTQYQEGDILFSEDENPHYLYFLLKGVVKEYKYDTYGKSVVVQHYFTPNIIGEAANFENLAYNTTAECVNECIVFVITYKDFEKKFLKNPEVSRRLMLQLAKKIKKTLNYNMPKDSISKLAEFIYENEELFNSMKKYKIAEMLNISPETLSRLLKKLYKQQIIEHDQNGRYKIVDKEGLKQLYTGKFGSL